MDIFFRTQRRQFFKILDNFLNIYIYFFPRSSIRSYGAVGAPEPTDVSGNHAPPTPPPLV